MSMERYINKEEEAHFISIHSIYATNDIYMYYYDNFIHKYFGPFLSSNNHEDESSVY